MNMHNESLSLLKWFNSLFVVVYHELTTLRRIIHDIPLRNIVEPLNNLLINLLDSTTSYAAMLLRKIFDKAKSKWFRTINALDNIKMWRRQFKLSPDFDNLEIRVKLPLFTNSPILDRLNKISLIVKVNGITLN